MILTGQKIIGFFQQLKYEDFTDVAKSLGVLTDNKLSWQSHIDKLYKSFSAQLKMLKRMKLQQVKQRGHLLRNDSAKCNILYISLGELLSRPLWGYSEST